MISEYSARAVSLMVVEHLERRRPAIVGDEAVVRQEIRHALEPLRRSYAEMQLPSSYFDALEEELVAAVPARWRAAAERFTRLEGGHFSLWRGGDVVARITYLFAGFVIGALCLYAPFIPIWEKWFPFALAVAAWWLPDAQVWWQRRRYSRELGEIVATMERAQPALDARLDLAQLLPPEEKP